MVKNYFKVAGILGAIALICAALIASINLLTSPVISKNEKKTQEATYAVVQDAFSASNTTLETGKDFTADENGYIVAKALVKSGDKVVGYIYTTSGKNAYGGISLMVGVEKTDAGYSVVDVEFLTNTESFASTVDENFKANYPTSPSTDIVLNPYGSLKADEVGSLSSDDLAKVNTKCGATYGANLVKGMVTAALAEAKEAK